MATVSQPGSRAGLITTLVIFVILFFISAIFAVMKNSELNVEKQRLENLKKSYAKIITDPELSASSGVVDPLREAPGNNGLSFYAIAMRDRDDLSRAITGNAMAKGQAVDAANKAVEDANKTLKEHGVSVPGGAMITGIDALTKAIVARTTQVKGLEAQIADLGKQLEASNAAYQKAQDELKKAIEAQAAKTTEVTRGSEQYRADRDAQIATLEKTLASAVESGRKIEEELRGQVAAKEGEVTKVKADNKKLVERLAALRPTEVAKAMYRQPDGKIIQVNPGGVCYINRGLGEQISPGMTFQIYDKGEGIPRVGDIRNTEEELPPGKGSLEVVRVSQGSSECRIIKMAAGQQVAEGDLIANVVYDPRTKFKFHVYGNFDLDQNGIATPQEAEIVKRLIVQWGGQITDRIAIETDFVVMGKEPVVPNRTKEQLDADPILKFEDEKAREALKKFQDVQNEALGLHIPVLNQNRFLYMVGFYDQAKK
jgi:hypothetical protein